MDLQLRKRFITVLFGWFQSHVTAGNFGIRDSIKSAITFLATSGALLAMIGVAQAWVEKHKEELNPIFLVIATGLMVALIDVAHRYTKNPVSQKQIQEIIDK